MIEILILFLPVGADRFGGFFIGDGQRDFHDCGVLFFYRQMNLIIAGKDFAVIGRDGSLVAQFELVGAQKIVDVLPDGAVDAAFEEIQCFPSLRSDRKIGAVMFDLAVTKPVSTSSVMARWRFMKFT